MIREIITALMLSSALATISGSATAAQTENLTVSVSTEKGEKPLNGTLFLPERTKKDLPLVVVVHEWWGKTDYPLMRAQKIADELGYAAIAVDLFGEGKTVDNPKDAQAATEPFYQEPALGVSRIRAFIERAAARTGSSRVAVIGYCFGGAQALNFARAGTLPEGQKLLGVVSFHGFLTSPLKAPKKLAPRLLVLHGEADQMVKKADVATFKKEMKVAGADLAFVSYPGASHAFTNPKATENGRKFQIPIAYNAKADAASWKKAREFLSQLFK